MSEGPSTAKASAKPPRPRLDPSATTRAERVADLGLIAAFLALAFLLGAFRHKDMDFWWHLKAGDQIRATGQVPEVDSFTYGAAGHPWIDLHWIFQVALSFGFERFGVVGLNLAKCAITTLAVLLLLTARRREWPIWGMLLAWLPALLLLGGRMYIRPETLTLLYLSADLAILFRWDRRPWLAFLLPLIQVAWVNSQGLFPLGPIVIAFALIDAAARRGAFEPERRRWWRVTLAASALTGLACLANPYGLRGALYPLQLAATMSNPIFKRTIAELTPVPDFIAQSGFNSLPLQLHLLTMSLGALSFLVPLLWSGWAAVRDRSSKPADAKLDPKRGRSRVDDGKKARRKRGTKAEPAAVSSWRLSPFRLLLFGSFSLLSLAATRNSHQFAAVVGTVTAWNVGEWLAAIRARRLRLDPAARRSPWPRLAAACAIALTIAAVGSGRFYAWSKEGRVIGLGEEPLWFAHEAVKAAGGPGMPDRLVGFHNGHPSLYEYRYAPARKAYTDARLEVMGPELYTRYIELQSKIRNNSGGWADELDAIDRPAVLLDTVDPSNADLVATLLGSRQWRCVHFDPIAALFVHESYSVAIASRGVDFLARHFRREADTSLDDEATLAATAQAYRNVASVIRARGGSEAEAAPLILLGLDYARKLRSVDPAGLDGWKQAGLIENLRYTLVGPRPIPRFRQPFQPTFDLPSVRATHDLARTLEITPDDGYSLIILARLYDARGMDESARATYLRYLDLPTTNPSQRQAASLASDRVTALDRSVGSPPKTTWKNLSELDRVVADLLAEGRAATAADVIEQAHRPDARPWDWADRLAVLRLHLGQPALARAAWLGASGADVPVATRAARVAATYLIESNFDAARKSYREAIALDPNLFEARYGLALLEQDAGRAPEARAEAEPAARVAGNEVDRAAARSILALTRSTAPTRPAPR